MEEWTETCFILFSLNLFFKFEHKAQIVDKPFHFHFQEDERLPRGGNENTHGMNNK